MAGVRRRRSGCWTPRCRRRWWSRSEGLLQLFQYTGTPIITVSQSAPGGVNVTGVSRLQDFPYGPCVDLGSETANQTQP